MKVGDTVTWVSQAMGCEKEKVGIIIAMIPANHRAMQHIPKSAKASHIKFDTDVSRYERVLVEVSAGKNGNIKHYYCPQKSALFRQGNS